MTGPESVRIENSTWSRSQRRGSDRVASTLNQMPRTQRIVSTTICTPGGATAVSGTRLITAGTMLFHKTTTLRASYPMLPRQTTMNGQTLTMAKGRLHAIHTSGVGKKHPWLTMQWISPVFLNSSTQRPGRTERKPSCCHAISRAPTS